MPMLFVLVHGNHGTPNDFIPIEQRLLNSFPTELIICLKSSSNTLFHTHHGIATCASRLAKEVRGIVESSLHGFENTPLIIVAHSLGGLIARAALPIIFEQNRPSKLIPYSFITVSTPHLGSRRPLNSSTVIGNLWSRAVNFTLQHVYGQTGKELYLTDEDALLMQLSSPNSQYMNCLRRFLYCTFIAVPHYDLLVPFCSASCSNINPHPLPDRHVTPSIYIARHMGFSSEYSSVFAPLLILSSDGTVSHADLSPQQQQPAFEEEQQGNNTSSFERVVSYSIDDCCEVEYIPDMLRNMEIGLPKLRRVDLQIVPKTRLLTHDSTIQKRDFLCRLIGDAEMSRRSVEFIVDMIKMDVRCGDEQTRSQTQTNDTW
jgi:hypothetical protein